MIRNIKKILAGSILALTFAISSSHTANAYSGCGCAKKAPVMRTCCQKAPKPVRMCCQKAPKPVRMCCKAAPVVKKCCAAPMVYKASCGCNGSRDHGYHSISGFYGHEDYSGLVHKAGHTSKHHGIHGHKSKHMKKHAHNKHKAHKVHYENSMNNTMYSEAL